MGDNGDVNSAQGMAGLAHRTFWSILNAIKNIEVLVSLVSAGVLPKQELMQRLRSVASELQEPLSSTRTQIDFIEGQMRMLKLLVETSSSSIAAAGATGVPDMRLPQ